MPQAKPYPAETAKDFIAAIEAMLKVLNPKYEDAIAALYATLMREEVEHGFDLKYWTDFIKVWMRGHAESEKECGCGERIWMFWTRTVSTNGKPKKPALAPYDYTCLNHYARCPRGHEYRKGDRVGQGTFIDRKVRRGKQEKVDPRVSQGIGAKAEIVQETFLAEETRG